MLAFHMFWTLFSSKKFVIQGAKRQRDDGLINPMNCFGGVRRGYRFLCIRTRSKAAIINLFQTLASEIQLKIFKLETKILNQ